MAAGTLVLALATFASVRSANRAARVAERSLLAGLRPLLIPSRLDDAPQKISFVEGNYLVAPGAAAVAEWTDGSVLLVATLRNVGSGSRAAPMALLSGARHPCRPPIARRIHAPHAGHLRRSRRGRLLAGVVRDSSAPGFAEARAAIEAHRDWTIDVLYGDAEGGQRIISRFG
jgi:hypothetical protein